MLVVDHVQHNYHVIRMQQHNITYHGCPKV